MTNSKQICKTLMDYALAEAPTGAKARVIMGESGKKSVGILNGKPQSYDNAQTRSVSLTVYIGQQKASASSEDFSDAALKKLAHETVLMAKATPANKDAMLATKGQYLEDVEKHAEPLDFYDKGPHPDVTELQDMAFAIENAAKATKGVRCKSVNASFNHSETTVLTSEGFNVQLKSTSFVPMVQAIAGEGGTQTTAYSYRVCRHREDLPNMEDIGKEAAEKAAAKQGAKPIPSGQMTILFDREVTPDLLSMFAGAISGMAVDKGTSFLKDSMGQQVFAKGITVTDDPTIPRGLGSDPCDSQGIPSQKLDLVKDGVLQHWLLSMASAKRLGLEPNGRGDGTTNLIMQPGTTSRDDLIKGVEKGLLVTGMIGHSSNLTTGDFSRGAEGYLIENGKITQPVHEVTIAGNLKDMFLNMTPADDLKLDLSVAAPTVRIEGMMVAGK